MPSTTCFSEDSRLSMCVSGFTLNTVLWSDKRAHTRYIHQVNVFAHHMRRCVHCCNNDGVWASLSNSLLWFARGLCQQEPTLDNSDKYSFAGVYNIETDRYSVAGQSNEVTKSSNTFQPLTMIFANHLLVPSKTIDFVDSMNVLCSLALNSNVSLDIHLVYWGVMFRSNQQLCLKDCCFKL